MEVLLFFFKWRHYFLKSLCFFQCQMSRVKSKGSRVLKSQRVEDKIGEGQGSQVEGQKSRVAIYGSIGFS